MSTVFDEVQSHYESGKHAAIRGCWRVLANAPTKECHVAWYQGYDSVPREFRGTGPITGPIPHEVLELALQATS